MKKRIVLGAVLAAAISIGTLSACGNAKSTEQKAYEGFYCRTETEEIEDYEVTYTTGYLFNDDGTGVSYGQDIIDITWDDKEIHYADSAEAFSVNDDKLTVGDIVYDKIDGRFIAPNPVVVDVDNIENGIYHVYISEYGIVEEADGLTIRPEIYTVDSYDTAEINSMAEGDVIYINESLLPVSSIEKTDSGIININGGVENSGSALIADDEAGCFVYAGMDMERSYSCQGIASLALSDDIKLIDRSNPAEDKEYTGSDVVPALKEMMEEYPLTCHNCSIVIENGAIVEIDKLYIP